MNHSVLNLMQSIIGIGSKIAPGLCAHVAFRQWFKTHRHKTPKRELDWVSSAQQIAIPTQHGKINALIWPGAGPRVLLVHGWEGRASQMGAFVKPLNDAGFEVVSLDLPGHGDSFGDTSSLPLSAQAVEEVVQHLGDVHALIGHSFGGVVCLLAMNQGLQTRAVVTLGSPSKLEWLLDVYAEYLNFSPTAKQKLAQLLENKFGEDIWRRCDIEHMQLDLSESGLVIHDKLDKEVPDHHAEVIASASSARLFKTSGLGHRRLLRNQTVVEEVVNFISAQMAL